MGLGLFQNIGSSAPVVAGAVGINAVLSQVTIARADAVCLLVDGRIVTYAELAGAVATMAASLARAGVGHGDRVAIDAPRSVGAIVSMLATLRLGAAYVPLDPAWSPDLRQAALADAAPRALLASGANPTPLGIVRLDIDAILGGPALASPPPAAVTPDDLAYVMYTSGTTGRPKGVMVPHRAVLRLVLGADYVALGPDEVILQAAPLAFDASTFEIFGALLNGGRLVVLTAAQPSLDEIADAIARHGVTTAWLTAGLFHLMVDHRLASLRPLRQLLAGGDVLSPRHVATVRAALPGLRLINGYGPTENTTFSCCYTVGARWEGGRVPIGRPIAGTTAELRDPETGATVPDGEPGELFVGGEGVALGYLNRPDLTAERFVPDPSSARPGALLYRTGDRVCRRPDGTLEFLGRTDRQIKINGKRIELDAVETALRTSGLVEDAAVIAVPAAWGGMMISAFIVPTDRTLPRATLSERLRATLAPEMVPGTVTTLDALPLTRTGKVDRTALARLPAASVRPAPQPATATEAALLTLWRRILGTDALGPRDSFFDFGCTSMQMVAAHAAMTSAGYALSVIDVFRHANVASLAAFVASVAAGGMAPRAPSPPASSERGLRRAGSIERMRGLMGARAR